MYACFVAQPKEAGREFVVHVSRMTRRLDDDPYTDVVWGILTGYKADDALRIASLKEPLVVRRDRGGDEHRLEPLRRRRLVQREQRQRAHREKGRRGG